MDLIKMQLMNSYNTTYSVLKQYFIHEALTTIRLLTYEYVLEPRVANTQQGHTLNIQQEILINK
jgi:hypothetical protein